MKFIRTPLSGAFLLEIEELGDERGFFARIWCKEELEKLGLKANLVQCSISFNKENGTLRGMHYQIKPHEETKLVRCTRGSIYDVIIDLRRESPTFKQWYAIELSAANHRTLYIPEGLAHGYITLEDSTELFYQMADPYYPDYSKGVRWNDPAFNIKWPKKVRVIAERDANYEDFKE